MNIHEHRHRTKRPRGARWWQYAIVLFVSAIGVGAIGYVYAQRHVYTVTVRPGETAYIDVEVAMKRRGEHLSFAKGRNLPISCVLIDESELTQYDVSAAVVGTKHKIQSITARVRVTARSTAAARTVPYRLDFELNGEGGWPTGRLYVTVEPY